MQMEDARLTVAKVVESHCEEMTCDIRSLNDSHCPDCD